MSDDRVKVDIGAEKRKRLHNKKRRNQDRLKRQKRSIGYVQSVPSGDTVNIITLDSIHEGRPQEITLTLHGVRAPSLEKRYTNEDGKKVKELDEPFAWESREFLRQRVIGKCVIFRVEHSTKSRSYGEVWIPLKDSNQVVNIRDESILNGWVKVNENKNLEVLEYDTPEKEEYERLKELEEIAADKEIGVHTKNPAKAQASIRHVHKHNFRKENSKQAFELYEKIKHIPQHGVVEQVRSGSSLRIILLDRMDEIIVNLAGVTSPSYNRKEEDKSDDFGLEAKLFTEYHLLNKDVQVYLESIDPYNNFYATIKIKDRPDFDIALELLRNGLAKLVEWTLSKGAYPDDFKNAEKEAQAKRLKLWRNYKGKNAQKQRPLGENDFTGTVAEIVNTSMIKVKVKGGDIRNVYFSSINPPKNFDENAPENTKMKPDRLEEMKHDSAYVSDCKESLRKALIGKRVNCAYDYTYPREVKGRKYYSVYLKDRNILVDLLEEGLARVAFHGGDQPRSRDYQALIIAQNRAAKAGKGIHSSTQKARTNVNDLSRQGEAKAAQYFGFLKRAGRTHAVVQHVFNASKFKIFIPSENCVLVLSLAGLKTEQPTQAENPKSKELIDRYPRTTTGNKGLHYARNKIFQRDVDIEVLDVSKNGLFRGIIYFNNEDFALNLLKEGYAVLFKRVARSLPSYNMYERYEQLAKESKKNMWANYDPEAERAKYKSRTKAPTEKREKVEKKMNIVVTEIVDGGSFYYQEVGEQTEALAKLMEDLHALNLDNADQIQPNKNDLVAAKFSADGEYYRALVKRANKEENLYNVFFVDYGNSEDLPAESLRALEERFGLKSLPAQANLGKLDYIKCASIEENFGIYAASLLKELVAEKELVAILNNTNNGFNYLSVGIPEEQLFVNGALVTAGLATVSGRGKSDVLKALRKEESLARNEKRFMWIYGSIFNDSDDEY